MFSCFLKVFIKWYYYILFLVTGIQCKFVNYASLNLFEAQSWESWCWWKDNISSVEEDGLFLLKSVKPFWFLGFYVWIFCDDLWNASPDELITAACEAQRLGIQLASIRSCFHISNMSRLAAFQMFTSSWLYGRNNEQYHFDFS